MLECGQCKLRYPKGPFFSEKGYGYKCGNSSNKCECIKDTCGTRCGEPPDDGCGGKLDCKCTMANEVCDRDAGQCMRVPGPTADPSLFAPKPAPAPMTAEEAAAVLKKPGATAAEKKAAQDA